MNFRIALVKKKKENYFEIFDQNGTSYLAQK